MAPGLRWLWIDQFIAGTLLVKGAVRRHDPATTTPGGVNDMTNTTVRNREDRSAARNPAEVTLICATDRNRLGFIRSRAKARHFGPCSASPLT